MSASQILLLAMILACGLTAVVMFRISRWHSHEADYWYIVSAKVQIDPTQDLHYRPLLTWAQANPPSLYERVAGWKPVEQRMAP